MSSTVQSCPVPDNARLRQIAAERTPATPGYLEAGYEDVDAYEYIEDPFGVAETSAELSAGLLADGYGEDEGDIDPPQPAPVEPCRALAALADLGRASAALVARVLRAELPPTIAALGELLNDELVTYDATAGVWSVTEAALDELQRDEDEPGQADEERDTSTAWSYRVPYCDSPCRCVRHTPG